MEVLKELRERRGLVTWVAERRQGKTYNLCKAAILNCLENKTNSLIINPKDFSVVRVTKPTVDHILEDLGLDYKYSVTNRAYTFSNKTKLFLETDIFPEKLRGSYYGFVGIDEAKDIKDLDYLVKAIVYPSVVSVNGTIVLASLFDADKQSQFNGLVLESIGKNNLINTINKLTTT